MGCGGKKKVKKGGGKGKFILGFFVVAILLFGCKMPSRSTIEAITEAGCTLVDAAIDAAKKTDPNDKCRLTQEEVEQLKKELKERRGK